MISSVHFHNAVFSCLVAERGVEIRRKSIRILELVGILMSSS